PAVFCYDLMNEPVVPASPLPPGQWVDPHDLAGFHYVQYIALDRAGRSREQVAQQWLAQMVTAIREVDHRHLITLGCLPTTGAGFVPREIATQLDFLCVHIYPDRKDMAASINLLKSFSVGKP